MERPENCTACALNKNGANRLVWGRGPGRGDGLVLVGEAPGEQEALSGKPFVGPSGRLLDTGLRNAGIEPDWICNVVAHRPPGNRNPHKEEKETCWNLHIYNMIRQLKPRLIAAAGSVASEWLCGELVTKGHGKVFPSLYPDLPKVFVLYHPAHVLRDIPKRLPLFEGDLLGLRAILNGVSIAEAEKDLYGLVWDIEATGLNPRADKFRGIAWYDRQRGKEDTGYQETLPLWLIDRLEGSIGFNISAFDMMFLYWQTKDRSLREKLLSAEVEDVMLMARILQKPFGSLQALSAMELGEEHEGIKDMAKRLRVSIGALPEKDLAEKSIRDVKLTWLLYNLYRKELREAGLWQIYELERSVAPVVRRVEAEGIPLDRPYLEALDAELAEELEEKSFIVASQMPPIIVEQKTVICARCGIRYSTKRADGICTDGAEHSWKNKIKEIPPNPRSRDQVIAHLLSQGIPLTKHTKPSKSHPKGQISLDGEVLNSIDHPFVKDYARMASTKKQREYTSTLLGNMIDGRFYASFSQLGAVSGRFSSGEGDEELA